MVLTIRTHSYEDAIDWANYIAREMRKGPLGSSDDGTTFVPNTVEVIASITPS